MAEHRRNHEERSEPVDFAAVADHLPKRYEYGNEVEGCNDGTRDYCCEFSVLKYCENVSRKK